MDPTYPLVPIANFFSFFLVLLTLLIIGRPTSVGVCMFAVWTCLACLITAVNTIVWRDNMDDVAPIWCDITSHILVGFSVGVPACSLVNTRRISQITRLRGFDEKRERFRESMIDVAICIGIPILLMVVYYVVQSHRYLILEEYGCTSSPIGSGVQILLLEIWGVVLPLLSVILYLPKIVSHFYRQKKTMNDFLCGDGRLSRSTYLRILALGCLDIVLTLPVGILGLVIDIRENHVVFYQGWTAIHSDWAPLQFPKAIWEAIPYTAFNVRWNEWITVLLAIIFFALFGLSPEAWTKQRQLLRGFFRPAALKQTKTKVEFSSIIFGSQATNSNRAIPV